MQKWGSQTLSVVPSDRIRGPGHKVKHKRCCLNVRKHIFTMRVTEHWHGFSREVEESLSLKILKSHLDTITDNLLAGGSVWTGVLNKMTSNLNHSVILRTWNSWVIIMSGNSEHRAKSPNLLPVEFVAQNLCYFPWNTEVFLYKQWYW